MTYFSEVFCERSLIGRRMQGDPVAFRIDDDRTETMRADRVHGLEHLSAEDWHLAYRIADSPIRVEVQQYPGAADAFCIRHKASADTVLMCEDAKGETVKFALLYVYRKHRAVEGRGAIQIRHRNIEPHRAI